MAEYKEDYRAEANRLIAEIQQVQWHVGAARFTKSNEQFLEILEEALKTAEKLVSTIEETLKRWRHHDEKSAESPV